MRALLFSSILALSAVSLHASEAAPAAESDPLALPPAMLSSAVRLRAGAAPEQGTAFAVNLAEFGRDRPRFLLAAAHTVKGKFSQIVMAEIRDARGKRWVNCKLLGADEQLDVCLLEAEDDLPAAAALVPPGSKFEAGAGLVLIGCPAGTMPAPFRGNLTDASGSGRWQMAIPFAAGCAGGPVYDAETRNVLGMGIAGADDGKGGQLANVATLVPAYRLRAFVTTLLGPARASKPRSQKNDVATAKSSEPQKPKTDAATTKPVEPQKSPATKLPPTQPTPAKLVSKPIDPKEGKIHVLQAGENLSTVAKKYNLKLMTLVSANSFKDPNHLTVGTKILIPSDPAKLSTLSVAVPRE